jgi:DNA-directed RNA polymerase subunit M/transcription elongation factor TFIIS
MLPKIDAPIYELKLLSSGKKLKFRPFTVKEEKLFLMAAEADDFKSVIDTTKQVINNCVLDDLDIEELPIFDIENIFLQLRAKSIGEVVNLRYRCNNKVTDEETKEEKNCNTVVEIDVNINELIPIFEKKEINKIEITEKMGVVLKYPNFKLLEKYNGENTSDSIIETIICCIDYVYDAENVYYSKDVSKEELIEFVESMQTKDLEKFKEFFDSAPKIQKNVSFKCPKCKYEEDVLVEGLESFFV